MLARIDKWVGDTLFIPPIIRLCQAVGCTQYLVANLAGFLAGMVLFHKVMNDEASLLNIAVAVFVGLLLIVQGLMYGYRPGMASTPSHRVWRYIAFLFIPVTVLEVASGMKAFEPGDLFWFLLLTSEYARSIDTIPPRETKEETKPEPAKATK